MRYYKLGELGCSIYTHGFNINWGSGMMIEFWFNIKVALFINCKPRFYYNLG